MANSRGSTGSGLVRLTTYVPVEVRDQVDAWAASEKRTRANAARRLLENWLSAHPAPGVAPRRALNFAAALGPTGLVDEEPTP
ncbi:ribbon-helix-helix domain-containing protein [Streptomyces anandii]|uniref:ribbon-helix-helix domain-containing protein n=1 Tax=Streptomyces anandii TaxID=285454 RepID=UPI0016728C81|nr:hypothetical protein [Streptomyces anandii]GGX94666.1 hypothetical protein GCM10010510_44840 [Streptomyces anandii JCM 4720]